MEQRAGVTVEGVTQTVTVGDGSGKYGNCLQAAVATFLSTDLENVPDFVNENGVWWDCLFYGYLVKCGYLVRTVGLTGKPIPPERSLVFGDSPRGGGIKHLLSPKQGAWIPERIDEIRAIVRAWEITAA